MIKKLQVPLTDSSPRPVIELTTDVRGRGPLLVVIQAGAAGIDGSAAIAPHLESHFTVVSYDRRGMAGSGLPEGAYATIADHADDVARIISYYQSDGGAAYVLGVSIGAIIGLELMRRHPASVARLVAQEPPLLALLQEPRRSELRAAHAEVGNLFVERGLDAALQAGARLGELNFDDREPDVVMGAPPPDLARNLKFFLANEGHEMRYYEPKFDELARQASRIVLAVGASAPDRWIRSIAKTLAERLRTHVTELPGDHIGYQLRPRAFAGALVDLFR
jgi:pimeloyl-ACP methyl ester carboxylesterase